MSQSLGLTFGTGDFLSAFMTLKFSRNTGRYEYFYGRTEDENFFDFWRPWAYYSALRSALKLDSIDDYLLRNPVHSPTHHCRHSLRR